MADYGSQELAQARQDFRRARSRAARARILALLTGASSELLSYEDVRRKLRAIRETSRGVQNIPINAIIGSVGRATDFTRDFLPRHDSDEWRWAGVETAMTTTRGLPPIDVYQIDQAYFVMDGNHRVSVARQLGATHIEAYVTEVHTKVPLSPEVQPDDLILKAEHAEFLDRTHLDQIRPEADFSVSVPGQYPKLEEHISVHRYFMGINQNREIPNEQAIAHWYDTLYQPVVEIVRAQELLRDFPDRTEADLYVWIMEYRHALQEELDSEIRPEAAASDIAVRFGQRIPRVLARWGRRIFGALLPDVMMTGRSPGEWRQEQASVLQDGLFTDILVPITLQNTGWIAMEQALEILHREEGRLLGVHVVPSEQERDSDAIASLEAAFNRRCAAAGVQGRLVVEVGDIAARICERARWTSLITVGLAHPPSDQPTSRLSSGFRTLIQRCPSPVLAVPEHPAHQSSSRLRSALLAYDGSPKADEALYLSTYLAGRWNIPLTVMTVSESGSPRSLLRSVQRRLPFLGRWGLWRRLRSLTLSQPLRRTREYLEEHKVQATFVEREGPVGEAILKTAHDLASELIVMGGYGFSPVMQIVLGSAVDQVLRKSEQPVLICR